MSDTGLPRRQSRDAFTASQIQTVSLFRAYSVRKGWQIGTSNVIFEGVSDVSHCDRASDLHKLEFGKALLGPQMRVLPAGFGREGGVRAVEQQFQTLQSLIETDANAQLSTNERYKVIAVFDDDHAGRLAFEAVTNRYSKWRPHIDVFVLKRRFPAAQVGCASFERELRAANRDYNGMDCEIEDLLSRPLLERFIRANPAALRHSALIRGDAHHFEWNAAAGFKGALRKFVESEATLADMAGVIQLLRFLRRTFGLGEAETA